jgi:23S rRNA (uracil1939-C5)-methyltransferase
MTTEILDIESLDLESRGIAHREGKPVFIDGALPGERVLARIARQKKLHDTARTERILRSSSQRVQPRCPYFGVCGGCMMQHVEPAAQVAVKQRVLEEALRDIGNILCFTVLPPIHGPAWGYRNRARLSVRNVYKKGGVLVGFRERRGGYVADMQHCAVLAPHVSAMLVPLRGLIGSMSQPDRIPQIEVAVGDQTTALTLRHMEPLTDDDKAKLDSFGQAHGVTWWLQPKGPETLHPLHQEDIDKLAYCLPEFGLRMPYKPSDFTQVNHEINRVLISRALLLLDVQPEDRVADLFCGLGNFTLPLATRASLVVGIEGSSELTARARSAAQAHGLQDKTQFTTLNLFDVDVQWLRDLGGFDRVLIDPPREGAQALAQALSQLEQDERPKRIVYVSCSPATLARDVDILVHEGNYRLLSAGVVNMFPHTGHVESIAVFE